ncbi:hypothetical protein DH2020_037305 [Rehmannia glutinosa]|uniref:F-box domain-containing protein n=1 Tax=Rehmannia glutinosa TaxID=99300 RepID=A0ABR0V2E2_REHGL
MTEENCHLPPEIVEEILCNLPTKSLIRFRCVSKSWRSLISEHRFVRKHLSRAAQQKILIPIPSPSANENMYYSQEIMPIKRGEYFCAPFSGSNYWEVLDSCDGLLCVRVDMSIYIWNPCLKTYWKILTPSGKQNFDDFSYLGFGYDSTRNDYKILKLSRFRLRYMTETQVFSLKSDSWRKLNDFPPQDYRPLTSVFLNGSIHWLLATEIMGQNLFALFSFDLSDDKYREVRLPEYCPISPCNNNYVVDLNLCILKGMLCVLVEWKSCLVLWAMKDYYSDHDKSWTKILDIRLDLILEKYCIPLGFKPFYLYENGEVMMGIVSHQRTELLICKVNTVLSRDIIFNKPSVISYGFVHVESLVSPLRSCGKLETRNSTG